MKETATLLKNGSTSVDGHAQSIGRGRYVRSPDPDLVGIARHIFVGVVLLALAVVLLRLLKMTLADSWREWQLLTRLGKGNEANAPSRGASPSLGDQKRSESLRHYPAIGRQQAAEVTKRARKPGRSSKRRVDKVLLAAEIFAVAFVLIAGLSLWYTLEQLNGTYRVLQQSDPSVLPTVMAAAGPQVALSDPREPDILPPLYVAEPARPTPIPTSTPVMAVARAPESTPTPVPSAGLAQRIQIPAIKVDSFVFPDTGPSTLKMGVVQYGERTAPGAAGNIVLAAHNDIFGAVFRNLDQLAPGDSLVLYEDRQQYVYRVRKSMIVEPDATWVMNQTRDPTLTLISCYPFLIDSQRIVVIGELVE